MPSSNAMENDKKRLRNQFTKDERTRLLAIMTEYGVLLDDKNISILSRKEIWEIIENKFNENGHSGRTSAQLKKYWQNYKYHSKRTKIVHREVPKPMSPVTKQMVRMLAKVKPEEWTQYDVRANAAIAQKSATSLEPSVLPINYARPSPSPVSKIPNDVSPGNSSRSRAPLDHDQGIASLSSNVGGEGRLVVSSTELPGSSVTVSVICPEVPSKGRTIFWTRNVPAPENIVARLNSSVGDEGDRSSGTCNSPDAARPDVATTGENNETNSPPSPDERRERYLRKVQRTVDEDRQTPPTISETGDEKEAAFDKMLGEFPLPAADADRRGDFSWLKLYFALLRSVGRPGGSRCEEEASARSSTSRGNEDNATSATGDQGTDRDGPPAKVRVRRVSAMTPQRDIKMETEEEEVEAANVTRDQRNGTISAGDNRSINSTCYLTRSNARCCSDSELGHRLQLQKLEMEEKELRVRIADAKMQETRLRIEALVEERLRSKELHELRLAQLLAEKVRSEAEHAARLETSCVARAEGRARIAGIERDRERAENFYQLQLRCMGASGGSGKCKP